MKKARQNIISFIQNSGTCKVIYADGKQRSWFPGAETGWIRERKKTNYEEISGLWIFVILMVMVSKVYVYVKTHPTVYSNLTCSLLYVKYTPRMLWKKSGVKNCKLCTSVLMLLSLIIDKEDPGVN